MKQWTKLDHQWMEHALELAVQAESVGEVPVGAVIVEDNQIIGEGYNQSILKQDATAHAEMNAIRAACSNKQNYRLPGATMYVTLEPCSMCAGALIHARVDRVVIATREPRAGAAGSVLNLLQREEFNHQCNVEIGLLQENSSKLLKTFFKNRR